MKTHIIHNPANKPPLSLEQKIRKLAGRFRAAERRRKKHEAKRSVRREFQSLGAWALGVGFVAFVAFSSAVRAESGPLALDEANAAFAAGKYRAAIEQDEAVLAHHGFSAPVLFNLGNAFYQSGDLGAAILNYQRAQVLAPGDRAIAANLRLACEKAGVPSPAQSGVKKAADSLNPNTLAWIGSLALTTLCLGIGIKCFLPRFSPGKAMVAVGIVLLVAVVSALAIRWPEFDGAIIVAANAPARIAPAGAAAGLFALKAGESVTTVRTHAPFVLIRTSDGRCGWVNEKQIGRIFSARPQG
jgi:tetratricopeptide (TPR) repeat protein